jgi:hypothetical protein
VSEQQTKAQFHFYVCTVHRVTAFHDAMMIGGGTGCEQGRGSRLLVHLARSFIHFPLVSPIPNIWNRQCSRLIRKEIFVQDEYSPAEVLLGSIELWTKVDGMGSKQYINILPWLHHPLLECLFVAGSSAAANSISEPQQEDDN